jgi:hypothetical protein
MALMTDTFVKNVKHTGAVFGDKYSDARAMPLRYSDRLHLAVTVSP